MIQRTAFCAALLFTLCCLVAPAFPEDSAETINRECSGAALHAFAGIKISERLFGLPGIGNAGRIHPCIYRGNQPASEGYQTLSRLGIRTVINLRSSHDERKEVEGAGMRYLEFPLSMKRSVDRERLREIVGAMSDPANQPVFIHCALGQDRTGIAVAAYRLVVENWSYAETEQEMQSFGFNDAWVHLKRSLKEFAREVGRAER